MNVEEVIGRFKLIPVIKIDNMIEAESVLCGLSDGGLPLAEITLRTEAGLEAIKKFSSGKVLVGAGTVLNSLEAQNVIDAGAKFVVSPTFDRESYETCDRNSIPYYGGVVTPTEVRLAMKYGATILKLFPAVNFGGKNLLKDYMSVFSGVKFIPTGGIDCDNIGEYLSLANVFAVGGSFMAQDKSYESVRQNTQKAVETIAEWKKE